MDLFKLFGTIEVDNSKANKALAETSGEGEKAESKLGNAFKAVGKGAVAVGKTIATGLAVGGAAVGALVTKSVQAYAEYEQLVGGVETLYGASVKSAEEYAEKHGMSAELAAVAWEQYQDRQETVMENAANAYKTAGMSANEYMDTVNGFAASLTSSLGEYEWQAANYADMIVSDMADNANKMGTSMEAIQNAYSGFAKQNYTMLDNLKLGYGGTKEEMERLLRDAEKMAGYIEGSLDISKFSDIADAIHIVQEEMGITGTTAREASSTISGSIGMMKSSWQNLIMAISSDELPFDTYVDAFVESASTVAENLLPRIEIALNGVVQLIDKLAPVIIGKIPELLSTLLPSVISAATSLVSSFVKALTGIPWADIAIDLISGITEIFVTLVDQSGAILAGLLEAVALSTPQLISGIITALNSVILEIPNILEVLVTYVPWIIEELCASLLDNFPLLIDSILLAAERIVDYLPVITESLIGMVVSLVESIVTRLPETLPKLLDGLVSLISNLVEQIPVILPVLVGACVTIIELLGEQLPVLIPMLVDACIQIIYLLIDQLPVIIPMLIEACITIVMAIIEALPDTLVALVQALPVILQAVWDAIVMVFQNLPQWFGQIFDGVINIVASIFPGLGDHIRVVWDAIKNYLSTVWESIKNVLSTAWNSIKNVVSTVIDSIKNVISTVWESIKTIIKNVMNIIFSIFKGDWESVKQSISNILDAIWNVIKSVFTGIWNTIKSIFTGVWNTIKSYWTGIKNTFTSAVDGIKNIVTSKFNMIKDAMSKPIEKARETIKGIIDKIKGFFSGMKLEFPNIKLPHFKLSPSGWKIGDLMKGSIPKLGIEWYAKAMNNPIVMTKPTIWGYDPDTGNLRGGGEAGTEVVSGAQTLMNMIQAAVSAQNDGILYILERILEILAEYFPDFSEGLRTPATFDPDSAAVALARPMNRELGRLTIQKERGR